jgi:ribosomal protein S18 acetylase RimI-like enzyme
MLKVELRDLQPDELVFGAGVAARGLRDNPMTVAVLGNDRRHRQRNMERTFAAFLPKMRHAPLTAWRGDYVIGIVGMAPPGTCQISWLQVLAMLPRARPNRVGDLVRTMRWLSDWEERDLKERHWHVGPVAVEGGLQGMGIGSQLMESFCERMDGEREVAYLETDKLRNVVFYERFGFEVIDEAEVLETPNWFMRREPAGA